MSQTTKFGILNINGREPSVSDKLDIHRRVLEHHHFQTRHRIILGDARAKDAPIAVALLEPYCRIRAASTVIPRWLYRSGEACGHPLLSVVTSTWGAALSYRLLDTFRATFGGKRYIHRDPSLGDFVAMQLYEDLYSVGKSALLRGSVSVCPVPTRRHKETPVYTKFF